jgi:hypothetical protein
MTKTPLLSPHFELSESEIPDPLLDLSDTQLAHFEAVKSHFPSDPFCTDDCILRYLRATRWNLSLTIKRLEATLKWREEYKPHLIHPDEVAPEAESGKQFFHGFDKQNRPILYLVPKREASKQNERKLRFVVYNLEKACQLMPKGVESLVIVVDYDEMTMSNATSPSVGIKFLSILGDHYPERLGKCFILNPTWYLSTFLSCISPFLDEKTRAKIHVQKNNDEEIRGYVDDSHLLKEYGGESDFEWHFESYWEALTNVTSRQEQSY